MTSAPGLTCDGFLDGRLRLWQPREGYRAATDPVFLAAFAPARAGDRVLDLGCGVGTAGFCLARRVAGLDLHGLELQANYAALARRNADENSIPFTLHLGDVRTPPAALSGQRFDQVLANPPFHHAGSAPAADAGRDRANREGGGTTLADWIGAGLGFLAATGTCTLIHRHDRLPTVLATLPSGIAAEILPLAPRGGRPPKRVLLRLTAATGAAATVIRAPFVIHAAAVHERDGDDYSVAARAVLRDGGGIDD